MPIFETAAGKVLFIHIPKTGGTWIEQVLSQHHECSYLASAKLEGDPCTQQHFHRNILQKRFSSSDFAYVFMVVRHPISRMLSEYRYHHRRKRYAAPYPVWLRKSLRRHGKNPFYADNHFRPQHEFECLGASVFRFEDGLPQVIEAVSKVTGATYDLSHKPAMVGRARMTFKTPWDDRLIQRRYAKDFSAYGYCASPPCHTRRNGT